MKRVDCSANALFKSYGNICCSSWPFSLLDKLLMYKSDSKKILSTRCSDIPLIQMRDRQNQLQSFTEMFK